MDALKPEAQAVADLVKDLHGTEVTELPNGKEFLILPKGMEAKSLKPLMDEYLVRPERRSGQATLLSLDSLIAWVNRHKGRSTALFADPDQVNPRLLAVIDYSDEGPEEPGSEDVKARFSRHRGVYAFPLSKPWKIWAAADGRGMSQVDFAAFLEDNIGDVIVPPADGRAEGDAKLLDTLGSFGGRAVGPSRLLELAKGLEIHEGARVKNQANLGSGEMQLVYETEHRDAAGQPINVPNAFILQIPVFEMGAAYRIPVRLRYRLRDGKITWAVHRYRPELYFDDAFAEATKKAQAETEVPLFLGRPEGRE